MIDQRVAIVTVAFGHADVLPAMLQSVEQQTYPADQIDVLVVDNGDGTSAAVARRQMPSARVLEPGSNLGFAGGCNLAVTQSTASTILLINPDVVLAPDFIEVLVDALKDGTTGIVGARLLFPDGTLQHAGGVLRLPLALTAHRGHGEANAAPFSEPATVPYVTGAALGIRRTTWDAVDGFDASFWPAYFEEVDLCLRVEALGRSVRYIPQAIATHRESSALGQASSAFFRLYHGNRLRLLFKHFDDRWLAALWLPAELHHLRATADDLEIDSLLWSYRNWQQYFLAGNVGTTVELGGWQEPPGDHRAEPATELAWTLEQAARKRGIAPRPFESRVPGLARLRHWWISLATEAYLRPIIQQQNDFNASLVELAQALERQRRAADGAALCQGMLLAKVLGRQRESRLATEGIPDEKAAGPEQAGGTFARSYFALV